MKRLMLGSCAVILLAVAGWWYSQSPEPTAVPVVEPSPSPVEAKPVKKLTLAAEMVDPFGDAPPPEPVVIPDEVVEEAFLALADTADGYVVRCAVPDDVSARQAGFFERTWNGSTVTGIAPGPSGSVRLDDAKVPPGDKVAGRIHWENAVRGAVSPCTFVAAEPIRFQVTVHDADGAPVTDGQLSVCNGADVVPLDPSGSTTVTLGEGEVCALVVETKGDDGTYGRTLTTVGYRAFVSAGADVSLTLLPPNPDDAQLKQAIADGGAMAREAMFRPGEIRVDKARALETDLSEEARSFLMGRRR